MTLEVIGAGFGRTGTLSLQVALEELGFRRCYHMVEVFKHPGHARLWSAASRHEPVPWDELFAGYRATVDWPACAFYQTLLEHYPDARVILSVRDPERWYDSMEQTVWYARHAFPPWMRLFLPRMRSLVRMIDDVVWQGTFAGKFADRQHALAVFHRHNEEVQRVVPPERLLVYEVRQGWEPLCAFLGVPVPQGKPFPHLNDTAEFRGRIRKAAWIVRGVSYGVMALLLAALGWALSRWLPLVLLTLTWLVSSGGLVAGPMPEEKKEAPAGRTDCDGEPLPPGVLFRLSSTRLRQGDAVSEVAFGAAGKIIISASSRPQADMRAVHFWDASSGARLPGLSGSCSGDIASMALSPKRDLLALGSLRGAIDVWDVATRKEVYHFLPDLVVRSLDFSPDGRMLLALGKDNVYLCEAATGKTLRQFDNDQGGSARAAFAPDGKHLILDSKEGPLRLLDAATGKEVRRFLGQPSESLFLRFSPDGKVLASVSSKKSCLRLWEVVSGKVLHELENTWTATFSPDGKLLASTDYSGKIVLWDLARWKVRHRLVGHSAWALCLAFSPDGKTLVSEQRSHHTPLGRGRRQGAASGRRPGRGHQHPGPRPDREHSRCGKRRRTALPVESAHSPAPAPMPEAPPRLSGHRLFPRWQDRGRHSEAGLRNP